MYNIKTFIENNNLIKPYDTIVVGLSGGPDSVFLLYFLKNLQEAYKLNLMAAHLDHEWRKESFKDLLFCQELCKKLDITFIAEKASNIVLNKKTKGSKEELGRLLRRTFFEKVRLENNGNSIALGHHADDQQETFFIRLIRGATISGLSSMKPKDGAYIRPLLQIYKKEILQYLDQNKIEYLIDYTNESENFLRNRIRKSVIPALRNCDSRFDYNFFKTLKNIQQTEQFLESISSKLFNDITTENWLDIKKLAEIDPFLHKRIILKWLCCAKVTFTPSDKFFDEILKFLFKDRTPSHSVHTSWSIIKKQNKAFVEK